METRVRMSNHSFGIAYTVDGGMPPYSKIIGWLQKNHKDAVFQDLDDALEACEFDGWRGYVCEYPSGYRSPKGWSVK